MPPKRVKAEPVPVVLAPAQPLLTLPYPQGAWRIFAYVLAFFQPAMGLVLALLYWPGEENRVRRFSRWCLVLAILGWVLASGGDAVRSGVQSGEWFIQPY